VITDPTAIPETEDDAKEYEKELQAVGGDWPKVEPLARSLSQSDVATREARAMAYSALGNALENTGRADEAIDAYRRAVDMGDSSAQVMVDALLTRRNRGDFPALNTLFFMLLLSLLIAMYDRFRATRNEGEELRMVRDALHREKAAKEVSPA